MNISFEKEYDGKWYAILPEWPYAHEELEMVDGEFPETIYILNL